MSVATRSSRSRLGVTAWAAALSLCAAGARAAPAAGDATADEAALRDQVARLTDLVQSMARRDQEQIQALTAQVAALQARLDQARGPARTAENAALPRATVNAAGHMAIQGAPPEAETGVAEPRVVQNEARRFRFESGDGAYSIGLTGDIQFDSGAYTYFHPGSPLAGPQQPSNGVNARRARIGVTGTAGGNFAFALVYDAGNSSDQTAKGIETAQVIYNGLKGAAFEIGYSNTFFTLDQSTGSNDTLFLERASPSNIATNFNTGDARANAGVRLFGDRYWIGGYLTGPASGDSHTLTGERLGAFERVAVQALKGDDYTLHLGVGVDELIRAPNAGAGAPNTLSLSDQPELRIDPTTLLNTGVIGTAAAPVTGGYVLDAETAATLRNFYWQGEYFDYVVDRLGLANDHFEGAYGEVSWTLTGEHHAYNPQAAAYFRISPKHPFSPSTGEWGAWELAARVSYVDLNSNFASGMILSKTPAAVDGGLQRGYSFGLNWYPNELVRFMLDYDHVVYGRINGAVTPGLPLGAPIGADFDAVALRAQIAY
jgi:phosphate-selective porin OprO/OprP